MQKACGHPASRAPTARGHAVSGLFHSPHGVLFTFPSRYWFAIGHRLVCSLGGWAPRIRTGFHVSRPTWDPARVVGHFGYGALTPCGRPFQSVPLCRSNPTSRSRNPRGQAPWFGLLRVRSPLLAKSLLFSLPPGTEMFHFPGCRAGGLWIDPASTAISGGGLPHSEIHGSKRVGRSPWLIAASRVLRRLAMPRHPPHARQRLSESSSRPFRGRAFGSALVAAFIWFVENRFACQRSKGMETCRCTGGGMVGVTGVGPVTSSLSGTRSNQLSYTPVWLMVRWPAGPCGTARTPRPSRLRRGGGRVQGDAGRVCEASESGAWCPAAGLSARPAPLRRGHVYKGGAGPRS